MKLPTPAKLLVVLVALVVAGVAKLPLERGIASDLREQRLLPLPLDLETREQLGQTSFAIVLGGLRSVVAAMLNLTAHNHWEAQEWFDLEQDYRAITTLQPNVRYYWETAAWHLAYNAYADYGDKPGIPEARRRTLQREFLRKGISFLEQGVRNLPEDWRMWEALAGIHRDPHKESDLSAAAEAYEGALRCEGVPQRVRRFYFYALILLPDRGEDAWTAVQELWARESNRRFPSIRSQYYVLRHANVPENIRGPLDETIDGIWPDRGMALEDLAWHWNRRPEGFPMDGVREALEFLLTQFDVPADYNPLESPPGEWRGFPRASPQQPGE